MNVHFEQTASSVGRKFESAYGKFKAGIERIWLAFKSVLTKFGVMVHRGAECVFQKIVFTFEEVRTDKLLNSS